MVGSEYSQVFEYCWYSQLKVTGVLGEYMVRSSTDPLESNIGAFFGV